MRVLLLISGTLQIASAFVDYPIGQFLSAVAYAVLFFEYVRLDTEK